MATPNTVLQYFFYFHHAFNGYIIASCSDGDIIHYNTGSMLLSLQLQLSYNKLYITDIKYTYSAVVCIFNLKFSFCIW